MSIEAVTGLLLPAVRHDGIGFDAESGHGLEPLRMEERPAAGPWGPADRHPSQEWVPRFPPGFPGVSGIRCVV